MKETEMTDLIDSHLTKLVQSRRKAVARLAVVTQSLLLLVQVAVGITFGILGAPMWASAASMCAALFHVVLVTDAIKRLRKVSEQ